MWLKKCVNGKKLNASKRAKKQKLKLLLFLRVFFTCFKKAFCKDSEPNSSYVIILVKKTI